MNRRHGAVSGRFSIVYLLRLYRAHRIGGDTFLIYCPHRNNCDQLPQRLPTGVFVEEETANKVSLGYGHYDYNNLH